MILLYSQGYAPEFEGGRVAVYSRFAFDETDIETVANNMRATDRFEFGSMGSGPAHAIHIARAATDTYMVALDGCPVFIGGVHERHQGVHEVFGFGTAQAPETIPAITRYIKREWLPSKRLTGARRFEVRVPTRSLKTIRWLRHIGFKFECCLPGYAPSGEPHAQLALTYEDDHVSRT